MCDTPRQHPQALQLLRMPHLFLEPLPLLCGTRTVRDVQRREDDSRRPVVRLNRRRAEQHVEQGPVLPPPAGFDRADPRGLDLGVLVPPDDGEVLVGGIEQARALIDQLVLGVSDHLAQALVGSLQHPMDHHPNPHRRGPKMLRSFASLARRAVSAWARSVTSRVTDSTQGTPA